MSFRIKHIIPLFCLFLSGLLFSCRKEEPFDYESFRLDMVTCRIDGSEIYFQTDNGSRLFPEQPVSAGKYADEQRVMLNYVIQKETDALKKEYLVKVRSVTRILSKEIVTLSQQESETAGNDSLYLGSIWYGGECINIRYKIEFNHIPHLLSMIYVPEEQLPDDTLRLKLIHDRNNDPAGFLTAGYASFRIPPALSAQNRPTARIQINGSNTPNNFLIVDLK